jgi:hypothetical protein
MDDDEEELIVMRRGGHLVLEPEQLGQLEVAPVGETVPERRRRRDGIRIAPRGVT